VTEQLKLNHITLHGDAQSRAGMNKTIVSEYAEAMADGAEFPPIVVFRDGDTHWLADGFHRYRAAQEATLTEITADVREGTLRDAILHSVSANNTHGLRRSNDDKIRAVMTLLQDEVWRTWSDREIARRCGVSHVFVSNSRYKAGGNGFQHERTGADGKTYTVKHWGESGGHYSFWEQVRKFGLDEKTVLEQIQPGAVTVMDLKLSKQDTWRRLDQLAQARVEGLFPPDSYVKHPTGRYGRVLQCHPTSIRVHDYETEADNSWQLSGVKPAEPDEFAQWKARHDVAKLERERQHTAAEQAASVQTKLPEAAPTFALDDKVLVEGSDVIGTITDIGGVYRGHEGKVCVTRPNPNAPGVNMTHWVSALKVTKVAEPNVPDRTPTFAPGTAVKLRGYKNTGTVSDTSFDADGKEHVQADLPSDLTGKIMKVDYPVEDYTLAPEAPPVAENATPAITPSVSTFADNSHVRVMRSGRIGRVLKTAWEGGRTEKCHLEFAPADGEKRPTYYWYEVTALEAVGAQQPAPPSDDPVTTTWALDSSIGSEPDAPHAIEEIAPRPWAVTDETFIHDAHARDLAQIYLKDGSDEDEQAVTAFIVRAANDHADIESLLPALRRLHSWIISDPYPPDLRADVIALTKFLVKRQPELAPVVEAAP
jgi:hypothetical protein